jgi:hypothetical protein
MTIQEGMVQPPRPANAGFSTCTVSAPVGLSLPADLCSATPGASQVEPGLAGRTSDGVIILRDGTAGRPPDRGQWVLDVRPSLPDPRLHPTSGLLLALAVLALGATAAARATAASGSARDHAAIAASTRTITSGGRIGFLQLGTSTQAAVEAALGAPQSEAEILTNPGSAPAKGLGYECSDQMTGSRQPVGPGGPPYCRTAYYIDLGTGVLGGFWTVSTTYATSHGTHVSTPTQVAARQERHPAIGGCLSGITENSRSTSLFITVRGGRTKLSTGPHPTLHIIGGHVVSIAIESRRDPVGILFC